MWIFGIRQPLHWFPAEFSSTNISLFPVLWSSGILLRFFNTLYSRHVTEQTQIPCSSTFTSNSELLMRNFSNQPFYPMIPKPQSFSKFNLLRYNPRGKEDTSLAEGRWNVLHFYHAGYFLDPPSILQKLLLLLPSLNKAATIFDDSVKGNLADPWR